MYALLSIFLLCTITAADDTSKVTIGDESNFDQLISANEFALVQFYAPWCGHCKALAPEFESAAIELSLHSPRVALIKVDATVEEELAEKYSVRGFPSLKWFRKGTVSDYSGGRTEKTIVEWAKKKTGPPTDILKTRDEVEAYAEENEVVVIGFLGDSGTQRDTFDTAAYEDDASGVPYAVASPELASEFNANESPSISIFKKFDEGTVKYVGDWNSKSIHDFVMIHSMPLLIPFTEETAPKIFGGVYKTHFLIFCDIDITNDDRNGIVNEENDDLNRNIEKAMKQASKAYRGDMVFITIGSKSTRIIDYFGVDTNDYPTARLVEMSEGNLKKYLFELPDEATPLDLTSLSDISKFIGYYKSGKLSPKMKSEKKPTTNDGPVTIVVGNTFEEYVAGPNNQEDVLIEFYAPWCGHCKRLAPVWEQLGVTFKDIDTVRIAKMDATANEHEAVDLSGFPTIMMWPAGSDAMNGGIVYEGVRELSGFLEFIKENAVHPYTLPDLNHDEL